MYLSEYEDSSRVQFVSVFLHYTLVNGTQYLTCTKKIGNMVYHFNNTTQHTTHRVNKHKLCTLGLLYYYIHVYMYVYTRGIFKYSTGAPAGWHNTLQQHPQMSHFSISQLLPRCLRSSTTKSGVLYNIVRSWLCNTCWMALAIVHFKRGAEYTSV